MFTGVDTYLRYYEGLHKRTIRDVAALPAQAVDYKPSAGEGENAWGIGEIVRHVAGARLYFARAYRDEGWIFDFPLRQCETQADWLPVLEESFAEFRSRLEGTSPDCTLPGWRILLMCLEHEVHHRSQIDTYAGLEDWDPPHIYARSAEQVGLERERQRAQYSGS
jgi:uncharacterized damage-inducible protein DinB